MPRRMSMPTLRKPEEQSVVSGGLIRDRAAILF
jgi:hypothetical protein